MRSLVIALLIGTLQFSSCIGGLFSIGMALAANVPHESQVEFMSKAFPDSFACKTSSDQQQSEEAKATETGCKDAESCLMQATSGMREKLILALVGMDVLDQPDSAFRELSKQERPDSLSMYARAGPLHEDSRLTAQILVKRE